MCPNPFPFSTLVLSRQLNSFLPCLYPPAVTDNVNQSKGDKDPAEWMPSVTSYHCTYIQSWITVKSYYKLSIDSAEKAALTKYINAC